MRKKSENTKDHLLECAEKIFSSKGYYETKISDIVKMAHVARGTIYQYFRNKDDLFMTLIEGYYQQWEKAIVLDPEESSADGGNSFYGMEFLWHRVKKTAAFWGENRDRMNIILRVAVGLNANFECVIKSFEDTILDVIIKDIRLGQKWGSISKDINAELAGNAILGIIIRLTYHNYILKKNRFQSVFRQGIENEMLVLIASLLGVNTRDVSLASSC